MKSILLLIIFSVCIYFTGSSQNVVIVIIDGARYTETFGDPDFTYIPYMAELAENGAYLNNMYNKHQTYTSHAIPALWTGGWGGSYNITYQGRETQATVNPTIFEYFRKQKNANPDDCFYILKYISNLWLQSFHSDYGPDYWPQTLSDGSTDNDVLANTLEVIDNHKPQLMYVYLAEVDKAGHSGDWQAYTSAIQNADEIVNTLWNTLQEDDFYKGNTTMIVTNDHGRHDYDFSGHGCSCNGCQHIMFLAMGPDIKNDYISHQEYELADVAVTAAYLLDVNPEYATGIVIEDIFKTSNVNEYKKVVDIIYFDNRIHFELDSPERVTLVVYDLLGREKEVLAQNELCEGVNSFSVSSIQQSGIYIARLQLGTSIITKKFFIK